MCGTDSEQVLGKFLGHVNLGYRATTDPYSERRALHLMGITTEFSGRYSCRVSSIYEDEFRSKEMIIYGNLIHYPLTNVLIVCSSCSMQFTFEVKSLH